MRALFIFIIGIGLFIAGFVFITSKPQTIPPLASLPVETPIPFYDMTIPYLRSRTYHSVLKEKTVYEKHSNYTSYTTSYDSDGNNINGLLTIPSGTPPEGGWPAIVFVHGYIAPTIYKTTQRYVDYVDYLAKNGFVVFKIDLRGNGDSQGEPSGAYYSSGYVIDTLNAYAALQSTEFINKNKVGLWGHSMAGNITLRAFASKPTIPAVVIWAGAGYSYTDLTTYGLHDNSYRPPQAQNSQNQKRQNMLNNYGQPSDNSTFWKTVAPTNYLNDLKGAIELHQAKDDPVVSISYNEDLNALLDKTNVTHEFYEYPSGGHNISGVNFGVAMKRTVSFFNTYLTNK